MLVLSMIEYVDNYIFMLRMWDEIQKNNIALCRSYLPYSGLEFETQTLNATIEI